MVLLQVAGSTQTCILQEMPSVGRGVEECLGGGKGDKGGMKREVYLLRVYCYYLDYSFHASHDSIGPRSLNMIICSASAMCSGHCESATVPAKTKFLPQRQSFPTLFTFHSVCIAVLCC